jgi:hypothetical protein
MGSVNRYSYGRARSPWASLVFVVAIVVLLAVPAILKHITIGPPEEPAQSKGLSGEWVGILQLTPKSGMVNLPPAKKAVIRLIISTEMDNGLYKETVYKGTGEIWVPGMNKPMPFVTPQLWPPEKGGPDSIHDTGYMTIDLVSQESMNSSIKDQQAKNLAAMAKNDADWKAYVTKGKEPPLMADDEANGTLDVIFKQDSESMTTLPGGVLEPLMEPKGVLRKGTDADFNALIQSTLSSAGAPSPKS